MPTQSNLPLSVRVSLINGLVFLVGTAALVLSPASVSTQPLASELVVLALGLSIMLVTNAAILRHTLAPYDAMLRDLRDEQDRTNAAMLAGQEAERLRISRELHDEAGQSLTVALLTLRSTADDADPELRRRIEDSGEHVRQALDLVRAVARRLRPGVLEDLGLQSALAALSQELTSAAGVEVRRAFTPGLSGLSAEAELVVYRVAQEAMTNIARHARARSAELTLTKQGDRAVLRVSDDGSGIPTTPRPDSAGLTGMHERARLAGGTLTVARGPGDRGTVVELVLPLAGNDA